MKIDVNQPIPGWMYYCQNAADVEALHLIDDPEFGMWTPGDPWRDCNGHPVSLQRAIEHLWLVLDGRPWSPKDEDAPAV